MKNQHWTITGIIVITLLCCFLLVMAGYELGKAFEVKTPTPTLLESDQWVKTARNMK